MKRILAGLFAAIAVLAGLVVVSPSAQAAPQQRCIVGSWLQHGASSDQNDNGYYVMCGTYDVIAPGTVKWSNIWIRNACLSTLCGSTGYPRLDIIEANLRVASNGAWKRDFAVTSSNPLRKGSDQYAPNAWNVTVGASERIRIDIRIRDNNNASGVGRVGQGFLSVTASNSTKQWIS